MQYWVELIIGSVAMVAVMASAFEGLRLWRDWRRSGR
jgi:hypothetical protein